MTDAVAPPRLLSERTKYQSEVERGGRRGNIHIIVGRFPRLGKQRMSEQSNARDGHWQMQRSGVCSPHSADRDRGTPLPRPPGGVPPPSWSRNVNGAAAALSSVPLRCSQRLFLAGRKEGSTTRTCTSSPSHRTWQEHACESGIRKPRGVAGIGGLLKSFDYQDDPMVSSGAFLSDFILLFNT